MAPVPVPVPVLSLFERLTRAYGIEGHSLRDVADEATARVSGGLAPGRVDISRGVPQIVHYGSAIEAALDYHRWDLERRRADAECQLAAVLDDHLEGGWGDAETVNAARALVTQLRAQERECILLWPLAERISLGWQLKEVQAELVTLDRPPDRELLALDAFSDKPPGVSAIQNREDNARDHLRFAARRAVARQNAHAQGSPSAHSMACSDVGRLKVQISEWAARHPALDAAFNAEWAARE